MFRYVCLSLFHSLSPYLSPQIPLTIQHHTTHTSQSASSPNLAFSKKIGHWLKKHHRHPTVKEMNRIKKELLKTNFPNHSPKEIHSGYHRGRRGLFGPIILPDIVSVHHLHLHVIVEPRFVLRMFKYPSWLRLMWVSDERVMAEAAGRKRPRMKG